jgi:hypothetical protein
MPEYDRSRSDVRVGFRLAISSARMKEPPVFREARRWKPFRFAVSRTTTGCSPLATVALAATIATRNGNSPTLVAMESGRNPIRTK